MKDMKEPSEDACQWDSRVYEALAAHAEITGWDNAEPYLKRHTAEHAASASQLADLLPRKRYLSNADATTLLPLLRIPLDGEAQSYSAAFCSGADFHRSGKGSKSRSQRLLLDRARTGKRSGNADRVPHLWTPRWCAGSALHPAQIDVLRHTSPVESLVVGLLDDRPIVITGSHDGTARVWDLTTGTTLRELNGHAGPVEDLAIGHLDNHPIVITGARGTGRVWDLATGATLREVTGLTSSDIFVITMALANQDDGLITVTDSSAHEDEHLEFGRELYFLHELTAFAGDPDANMVWAAAVGELDGRPIIVTGADDQTARVWDFENEDILGELTGHTGSVTSVAISRLNSRPVVITGSHDGTARIWDLATSTIFHYVGDSPGMVDKAVLGNLYGRPIAVTTSYDGIARIWDLDNGTTLGTLGTESADAIALGDLDGQPIAITGSHDRIARIWDLDNGTTLGELTGHTGSVFAVVISTFLGRPIAITGSSDGTARVWDLATGATLRQLTGHTSSVDSVAVGRLDGRPIVITGSRDGTARVWDLATGATLRELTGHTSSVGLVAVGRLDGRPIVITASDDGTACVWDPATGHEIRTLTGRTGPVERMAFGELDGHAVALSGTLDGTVRVRSLSTGELLHRLDFPAPVNSVAFNADSGLLVAYGSELVRFDPPQEVGGSG